MKDFILKYKYLIVLITILELFFISWALYGIRQYLGTHGFRSPIYVKSAYIVKPRALQKVTTILPKLPVAHAEAPVAVVPEVADGQGLKEQVLSYFPKSEQQSVDNIVQRESTWNPQATNVSSGACGLFQADPCSKMGCDSLSNIACQTLWGEAYINSRYGDANKAWAFERTNGYY